MDPAAAETAPDQLAQLAKIAPLAALLEADAAAAVAHFQATAAENVEAAAFLAYCTALGIGGIARDPRAAVAMLEGIQGSAFARGCLTGFCEDGFGTTVASGATCIRLYREAAEAGDVLAMSRCAMDGIGSFKDVKKARRLARAALDAFPSFVHGQCQLAYLLLNDRTAEDDEAEGLQPNEAARLGLELYQAAFAAGYPIAGYILSGYHEHGLPPQIIPSYDTALRLLRDGVDLGCPISQMALGRFMLQYEQNYVEGARLLSLSAAQNCDSAIYTLGSCYETGYGVSQDIPTALRLYETAFAIDGLKEAALQIAEIHALGEGTPKNTREALRWFVAAASPTPYVHEARERVLELCNAPASAPDPADVRQFLLPHARRKQRWAILALNAAMKGRFWAFSHRLLTAPVLRASLVATLTAVVAATRRAAGQCALPALPVEMWLCIFEFLPFVPWHVAGKAIEAAAADADSAPE